MAINKPTLFGVFAWREDGKYKIKDSIGRLYRRKSAAQKMADALNSDPGACARSPRGYVVMTSDYCSWEGVEYDDAGLFTIPAGRNETPGADFGGQ